MIEHNMRDQIEQAMDEEQAFLRCVELAQMAVRHEYFTPKDIEDLIYHLGVRQYFKGDEPCQKSVK